jgi:lysophospholipase L1-like esterase
MFERAGETSARTADDRMEGMTSMFLTGLFTFALATAPMTMNVRTPHDSALQRSVSPIPRDNEEWWIQRHFRCIERTHFGGGSLAFLGDSITQGWEGEGKRAWNQYYAPLGAANFGFSGDRTEHVLWRLKNGELLAMEPKVVVLLIGTNNLGHGSSDAQQTADGVKAIVQTLLKGMPKAKVLLLGILPRGAEADDPLRLAVAEATKLFAPLHDGKKVFFLDIGKYFVRSDGSLRTSLMPDYLHLNADGYDVWAKAMNSTLEKMLKS